MLPLIEQNQPQIAELCRRYDVKRLELFGSAATGKFDPASSDVDFLVEFPPEARKPWGGELQDLKEDLEKLFERKVDLISNREIENPYKRRSIDASRRLVYAA